MNEPFLNFLEGLNDIFVLLTAYSMILFTDFVPDVIIRNQIGDVFYNFVFVVLGLNLLVIAAVVKLAFLKKAKKWWIRKQL